jgi:hypothetical protein
MSALPPKADIRPGDQDVCFGPIADIALPTVTADAAMFPRTPVGIKSIS